MEVEVDPNHIPDEKQAAIIQSKLAKTALEFLENKYPNELASNKHVGNLKKRFEANYTYFSSVYKNGNPKPKEDTLAQHERISLELLNSQRNLLDRMNHKSEFDEDIIRKYLYLLDLEETKLRENKKLGVDTD